MTIWNHPLFRHISSLQLDHQCIGYPYHGYPESHGFINAHLGRVPPLQEETTIKSCSDTSSLVQQRVKMDEMNPQDEIKQDEIR